MKCKGCIYRKNCQYLAKHNPSGIDGCTAYKSEADFKREVACELFDEIMQAIEKGATNATKEVRGAITSEYMQRILTPAIKMCGGFIGKSIVEVFEKYEEGREDLTNAT